MHWAPMAATHAAYRPGRLSLQHSSTPLELFCSLCVIGWQSMVEMGLGLGRAPSPPPNATITVICSSCFHRTHHLPPKGHLQAPQGSQPASRRGAYAVRTGTHRRCRRRHSHERRC